jgi:cell division protein FtsL
MQLSDETSEKRELTSEKRELTSEKRELTSEKRELTSEKRELTSEKRELYDETQIKEAGTHRLSRIGTDVLRRRGFTQPPPSAVRVVSHSPQRMT